MKLEMRQPVYNTGCGWADCPECGPLIALEIEAEHRKMVARTWPERDQASEWLADAYGTGQERYTDLAEAKKEARAMRTSARERLRVKRVLTFEQRKEALALLEAHPLRKAYKKSDEGRAGWMAEVWLELENPNIKAAAKESKLSLKAKVKRAIKRAEDRIDYERKRNKRLVCIDNQ